MMAAIRAKTERIRIDIGELLEAAPKAPHAILFCNV